MSDLDGLDGFYAVKAWDPEDGDEPDERNVEEGILAPDAAEDYAERHFADNDYPDEMTVHVRCADGALRAYAVEAERTVSFNATETTTQLALPAVANKERS